MLSTTILRPAKGTIAVLLFLFVTIGGLIAYGPPPEIRESSAFTSGRDFFPSLQTFRPLSYFLSAPVVPDTQLLLTPPVIGTDKRGYRAGETVTISGSGFAAGQIVNLQVTHIDGSAEPGGGHSPFTAVAGSDGTLSSSWTMGRDSAGNRFRILADGAVPYNFFRQAQIQVDKFDYQLGETAIITADGFNPGEIVTLQVVHSNGRNDGSGHLPFDVAADSTGSISSSWFVDPADSANSIFRLTAVGWSSRLKTSTSFTDPPIFIKDDAGPDDEPGQKDLSFMSVDYNPGPANTTAVLWGWDDTEWSGNNTGDACALFDTDLDGFANFAFCATIAEDISDPALLRRYSCNNTRVDRCAGPTLLSAPTSSGSVSVVANSDPFRPGQTPAHSGSGNNCDADGNCLTSDSVANISISNADVGGNATKLTNVCSYPSQEPNSDPSDCIITPNNGLLTIIKVADPNDGTAFTVTPSAASQNGTTSFPFTGSGTISNVSYPAGNTLDLNELNLPSGWSLQSASCILQNATNDPTGTPTATGVDNLTIQGGLTTVCTFNNRKAGSVTILKNVTAGSPQNGAIFGYTTVGLGLVVNPAPITISGGTGSLVINNVTPGSNKSVSETSMPPGWSAAALNPLTCLSSTGQTITPVGLTATFNVAAGENITCTYLNTFTPPKLIVIKHVINDSGGTAVAGDFTMSVTGTNPTPSSFPGAESPGTDVTLTAGAYSVGESGPSGYTASYSADCSGTIADGDTKTCTVTNDDQPANLIIIKNLINDNGGAAVVGDFNGTITGTATFGGGNTWVGTAAPGQNKAMTAAGTYNVVEAAAAGYATTYSADCSGSIALGQTKTCTVTNNDQVAHLIVIKHVINDSGGTATAADFTLDSGGINDTPDNFPGAESPGTDVTLDSGAYSVGETGPAGYTASYSADCSGTIANGQTKTCTVTNDDQPANLIIIKNVINDNGGGAPAGSFGGTITGTATFGGGNTWVGTVAPGQNKAMTAAGTYTVVEGAAAGYTTSYSAGCTGSIALGDTKTCTVTNDDIAPRLHLRKQIVNDNGGSATVADFTLRADGAGSNDLSGTSPVDSGPGLVADTFALSETLSAGAAGRYSASAWVCVGGVQVNSTITLAINQEATCTITNDDRPGTIIVKKITQPATDTTTMFSFDAAGDGAGNLPAYADFVIKNLEQNSQDLDPGAYTVSENVPLGWVLSAVGDCAISGGGPGTSTFQTNSNSAPNLTVNLVNGDTVTCTFDNTGQGATRTQGFWGTHPELANIAWFGGAGYGHNFPGVAALPYIGDTTICTHDIANPNGLNKLMAGFWSSIPKKSNNQKRLPIDQSRMQLLQQLLAAELNASAFGTVPPQGTGAFNEWENAFCGNSITAINRAQQEAGAFNSQGDSSTFTPGINANSQYARQLANVVKTFWDNLP